MTSNIVQQFDRGDQRLKDRTNNGALVSGPKDDFSPEEFEEIDTWGKKVAFAMQRNNPEAAHEIVDLGIAAMHHAKQSTILATPLAEIYEVLLCNLLEDKFDALTVGDLLALSISQLMAVPNFGLNRIACIYATLANFGINRAIEFELAT